jgi:hypothetical protein
LLWSQAQGQGWDNQTKSTCFEKAKCNIQNNIIKDLIDLKKFKYSTKKIKKKS